MAFNSAMSLAPPTMAGDLVRHVWPETARPLARTESHMIRSNLRSLGTGTGFGPCRSEMVRLEIVHDGEKLAIGEELTA